LLKIYDVGYFPRSVAAVQMPAPPRPAPGPVPPPAPTPAPDYFPGFGREKVTMYEYDDNYDNYSQPSQSSRKSNNEEERYHKEMISASIALSRARMEGAKANARPPPKKRAPLPTPVTPISPMSVVEVIPPKEKSPPPSRSTATTAPNADGSKVHA